jgi:hypothetical protein
MIMVGASVAALLLVAGSAAAHQSRTRPAAYAVAYARGWAADAMGVHRVAVGDAMYLPCAPARGPIACKVYASSRAASRANRTVPRVAASAANVDGCSGNSVASSFTTYVSASWTTLDGRYGPCQATGVGYQYHTDDVLYINHVDYGGQFICKGRSYGYGSETWYRTGKNLWVWSGGTTDPNWNGPSC